jgi:hypothetical protein
MSKSYVAALAVCAGFVLSLGLYPNPLDAAQAPTETPQRVRRAASPAPTLWLVWAVEAPRENAVAFDTEPPSGEENPDLDLEIDEWDPQVLTGHAQSPALGFLRLPQGGERSWKVLSAVPLAPFYGAPEAK